jgi:hypothetical protein
MAMLLMAMLVVVVVLMSWFGLFMAEEMKIVLVVELLEVGVALLVI